MLPDLTQYLWIAWLVLALLFVIIELLTLEFTFLMLAAGSLIGGLGVNLLGGAWWLQVLAAAAVSALLLFTIRPLLLRALRKSSELHATNVDAIYGLGGRLTAPFTGDVGAARLDNGELWSVIATPESASVAVGDRVTVVAVRGSMVEIAPASPASSPDRSTSDG
jgi:Membrane protein implicated in regulation of membrane protease activity